MVPRGTGSFPPTSSGRLYLYSFSLSNAFTQRALPPVSLVSNPQQCASGVIAQLGPEEHVFGEEEHLAVAAEAEVGDAALDLDLADQHAAAVPDVDAVAAARVHVAVHVALDAVRDTRVRVGEDPPVR